MCVTVSVFSFKMVGRGITCFDRADVDTGSSYGLFLLGTGVGASRGCR